MVEQFSKLGEHGAIWVAIGLTGAALDEPRRDEWLRAARRVVVSYAANQLIKVIVRRPRPAGKRASTHSNLSFPSAHATTSFCGARCYARLGLALYPLAAAFAASRLVLRVHHPSDVVAGAVLGTVIAR
ncbi:MAG: phosphoesterase PA-phosphatase related protein [Solirubrobacterales bacterium]|nr:phosphoesterase PA-phosphatase related protein [Solirubrobacterales bacterium]